MNRHQKKVLSLTAAIANLSFTVTVASIATYAWYSSNLAAHVNVNSANVEISTTRSDLSLTYEILKYSDDLKAGVSSTDPADFYLPDYDQYIQEKNEYANVILRAEISTSSLSTNEYEFVVDISRTASTYKNGDAVRSYTSNIIQFKATVYAYKEDGNPDYTVNASSFNSINESSAATKYATASAYFNTRNTPTTFVPIRDKSDGSVVISRKADADTITLVPNMPADKTITSVIIYIECSYHEKLVNEYINTNIGENVGYRSLDGDITKISFDRRAKSANTSLATGKYIKVESDTTAATGQYLPTYEYSAGAGKILDGEKAEQDYAPSNSNSRINQTGNYKTTTINNAVGGIPKSIDSTDDIDASSFAYNRTGGTFQASTGKYIGHNANSGNGIQTNGSSDGLQNDLSFVDGQVSVTSHNKPERKLQFNSAESGDKFAYYTSSQQDIDLYRYTENASEMPSVTSISYNTTNATKTFYTNHTFNVTGLVVTATYSDGSTADVTSACTFTSSTGVTTLVPEGRPNPTSFTSAEANKTVYINYKEGTFETNVSTRGSYEINIVAETITSISVTGTFTTQYYYVGDTFSPAGITVKGQYNSGIADATLTESDGVTFTGYNMSSAGDYTVKANFAGCSAVTAGTIHVVAKTLTIDKSTLTVAEGESATIAVTHNQEVTITNTPGTGSVTLNPPSSIAYSGSNKATQNHNVTVTGSTAGTVTLTFTSTGATTRVCEVTVTPVPADHFTITSGDIVSGSSYQAHTKSVDDRDWIITYGGNNSSLGTNSDHRSSCNLSSYSKYAVSPVTTSSTASAFASTTKLNKIKSIEFSYNGGSNPSSTVYAIYSADNNSFSQLTVANGSFAQGDSMSSSGTAYKFTFNQAYTGYFALVFVAANGSGAWRIDDLSITFNPVVLSSIAISGDLSTKAFNDGDSVTDLTGLTVTATFDDSSTEDVTSSASFTVSPATLTTSTTSVTITASVTINGVTETASKSINGITVSPILVSSITLNPSSQTVSVSGHFDITATVSPSNATNKNINWSSSDSSIASVSGGTVTGVAAGSATITATAADGSGKTATCEVTVTSGQSGYTVSFNSNGGSGTMTSLSNVPAGNISFPSNTFTNTNATSFYGWSIGSATSSTIYTSGNIPISGDTTLYARWSYQFSWSATSGALGSGIGSGTINLTAGSKTFGMSYTRTLSSGSSYTGWTSSCIQLGKNGGVENITFTSSSSTCLVTRVGVYCSSYNNAHKVSIKVGSTTYLASTATAKWTTVDEKSGTGTTVGQITISFTNGTRALYIKSISVNCVV